MSHFNANENFTKHQVNMDYTAIKNMQAKAMDDGDWDSFDEAVKLEEEWELMQ